MAAGTWRALTILLDAALVVVVAALFALQLGPHFLPYRAFEVLSGSMEPAIPVGSEVIDVQVPGDRIAVGDVITYPHPRLPGAYVTHRVVTVDRIAGVPQFTTRGDANGAPDPWRVSGAGGVLKVVVHVPYAGYPLGWLASPAARLILVGLLALAALAFLFDLWTRPRVMGS